MNTVVDVSELIRSPGTVLDRALSGDIVSITSLDGDAVLMDGGTYRGLMATLHLLSDPDMLDSIREAEDEHDEGIGWRELLDDAADPSRFPMSSIIPERRCRLGDGYGELVVYRHRIP